MASHEQIKARFKLKETCVSVINLTLADVIKMGCRKTNVYLMKALAKPAVEELAEDRTCPAGTSTESASESKNLITPLTQVKVSPYVFVYNIRKEIGCLTTVTVKQDPIDSERRVLSCCDCDLTSIKCEKRSIKDSYGHLSDSDASTVKMCVRPTKRFKPQSKISVDPNSENKKPDFMVYYTQSEEKFTSNVDRSGGGDRLVICKEEFVRNRLKRRRILSSASPGKSSMKKLKVKDTSDYKKNEVARILQLMKSKLDDKRNSAEEDLRTVIFRDSSNLEKSNSVQSIPDSGKLEKLTSCEETAVQLPESDLRNTIKLLNQSKQQQQQQENELGNVKSRLGRQLSNEEFESALQNQDETGSRSSPPRSFIIPKKVKEEPIKEPPIEPEPVEPEPVVIEAPIDCDVVEYDETGWPVFCLVIFNSYLKAAKDPQKAPPTFPLHAEEMADLQDPGWSHFKETFLNRQLYSSDWNNQCTPVTNHNLSVQNYKCESPKFAPWYDAQKRYFESLAPSDQPSTITVGEIFEHRKQLANQYYYGEMKKETQVFGKADEAFRMKYKKKGLETLKYARIKENEGLAIRNCYENKIGELNLIKDDIGKRFDLGAEEVRDIRQRFHVGQFDFQGDAILDDWEVDELRETDEFFLKLLKAFHKPSVS